MRTWPANGASSCTSRTNEGSPRREDGGERAVSATRELDLVKRDVAAEPRIEALVDGLLGREEREHLARARGLRERVDAAALVGGQHALRDVDARRALDLDVDAEGDVAGGPRRERDGQRLLVRDGPADPGRQPGRAPRRRQDRRGR